MSADTPQTAEAENLGKALAMAKKINDKAANLMRPLEIEMRIMKWPASYREIMWEAVMMAARERLEAVTDGK
jgi:hypothetical protein